MKLEGRGRYSRRYSTVLIQFVRLIVDLYRGKNVGFRENRGGEASTYAFVKVKSLCPNDLRTGGGVEELYMF